MITPEILKAFGNHIEKTATSLQKRISSGSNVLKMGKKVKTAMTGKIKKPTLVPTKA